VRGEALYTSGSGFLFPSPNGGKSSSLGATMALATSLSLTAALCEFTRLTKEGAVTSLGLPCQGSDDFHGPGASPRAHCGVG
jgi:hypothetical protein